MTKPLFQMSADSRLLYQRMKAVEIGETVPLGDLEGAVSRPMAEIRGAISTARRRLLRDDGMVFISVPGVGYLRCTDEHIVDGAVADTVALRRKAGVAAEKLTKVRDFAALTPAKQIEHTTRLSVLSAIASLTKEPAIERVRKAAQGRATELPLAETLAAFSGAARA